MEVQTYSVIRAHRDRDGEWEKIVESGLDCETAGAKAVELSVAERLANPTKTSWTRDLFYCQLEGTIRHQRTPGTVRSGSSARARLVKNLSLAVSGRPLR